MLYTGKYFPVAVHGLKRMREVYQLRDLEVEHERVWDTRPMAHLLDPSRDDDHGYRLSDLDARIVACIHDSIWVEAASGEEAEAREIMKTAMTTAMNLSAPLEVDFEV